MLAWILVYFLLVVSVLALCFLPAARQQAAHWIQGVRVRSETVALAARRAGLAGAGHVQESAGFHGASARRWARAHARWIGLGAVLLVASPLSAFLLRGQQDVGAFDHRMVRVADRRIAELLEGEQLAPPAPLPPAWFSTVEVESVRPMIRFASREWALLDDVFRQRLLTVFKIMRDTHGYEMVLLEGYRSPERQNQLARLGQHVTQAGAFMSYHQYGLAADCAFLRQGRVVISERDAWAMRGYELYGQVARAVGLEWGGGWRSIKDYGHVELRRGGVLGGRTLPQGDNAHAQEFSGDSIAPAEP